MFRYRGDRSSISNETSSDGYSSPLRVSSPESGYACTVSSPSTSESGMSSSQAYIPNGYGKQQQGSSWGSHQYYGENNNVYSNKYEYKYKSSKAESSGGMNGYHQDYYSGKSYIWEYFMRCLETWRMSHTRIRVMDVRILEQWNAWSAMILNVYTRYNLV